MAFRKTISQDELAKGLSDRDRANGNTYQASRGGHFPDNKPVAGQPKDGRK
ncbi:hypothetical protein [Streptomyces sp. NPDC056132]|uniref:hypothetical protein n=1 Tax=Streptomyces sp. NPDC056132 TaxID=3345722 RepID=UPI0035D8151F